MKFHNIQKFAENFKRHVDIRGNSVFLATRPKLENGKIPYELVAKDKKSGNSDYLEVLSKIKSVEDPIDLKVQISKSSDEIAEDTLRASANHYTILEDGILIFYKNPAQAHDSPIHYFNNTLITNDSYEKYFQFIQCDVKSIDVSIFAKPLPHLRVDG